ncbi:MAG: hypothetical protein ACYS1A_04635 [Planctomycetota bacterium]
MKRYSADKIVLLGLFVLALLIARFITASRSAIVLTGPIELIHTGLSVSMPAGNGWRTRKQWKYQQNSFTLTSDFVPVAGSVKAQVHCQYILAATQTEPQLRFKQKAASFDGIIAEKGQIRTDNLTISWAHVKRPQTLSGIFLGTAQLPNNRQFDIDVPQTTGDTDLAERAFKAVVQNLKFHDNQLLKDGSEILAEIKTIGLNRLLDWRFAKTPQNAPAFFLMKNAAGQTAGFTMDLFANSDQNSQFNMGAKSFSYIRKPYARERRTYFKSDNGFNEFIWESRTTSLADRSAARIVLDRTGLMTVSKLSPSAEEKNYQLNPAAIPKILLELLFSRMLDSDYEKIIVDIIEADGTITPALVSKTAAAEKDLYVLRAELLNRRNLYEPTGIESILKQFPERTNYILQKNRLLE